MPNEPQPGQPGRNQSQSATDPARPTPASPTGRPVVPPQPLPSGATARPPERPAPPSPEAGKERKVALKTHINMVRTRLADLVWLTALVAAIVLSLGALLVALKANADNVLVAGLLDAGRAIDGPFWKVFDFYQENATGGRGAPDDVKNHLVNWGLAAVCYLVGGRIADRVIRP